MDRLHVATTEPALYSALRGLPLRRGVIMYDALAATLGGEPPLEPPKLARFAAQAKRAKPLRWSRRVRRQYRWALLRLRR